MAPKAMKSSVKQTNGSQTDRAQDRTLRRAEMHEKIVFVGGEQRGKER